MGSSGKSSSSGDEGAGRLPALPEYLLDNIINRLENAPDIARAQSVCRELNQAGRNVLSLRIICLDDYHDRARNKKTYQGKSFLSNIPDEYGPSTSGSSGSSSSTCMSFKEVVVGILKSKPFIVQLRIEVEPKLQSKSVAEGERQRTDFWLTDHYFVGKWLPGIGHTLQHLCIVDYGQQAIVRRSKIVKLLSEMCKHLKTLDLRNLFIDTSEMEEMSSMVSLTLRCVKVVAHTLQHLNENMPNLQTLALLGVFGAKGGILEFQDMKVLCLGLSTPAKDVVMKCPKLEKLQLKMQCPEKLIITSQKLKYVAFNLDVMEPSKVELISMVGLEELLYGATSFVTLSSLVEKNSRSLKKLFLDIPCMALAEDGRFLGVLKDTSLQLPGFNKLYKCKDLEVLTIGPGLWYSMETQVHELLSTDTWPSMKSLVVHMIPHDMGATIVVLRALLRVSVTSLDVSIYKSSPVKAELISPKIKEIVRSCDHINHFEIDSISMTNSGILHSKKTKSGEKAIRMK